uniref:Store-operated calcium entry-associated regulatory factor n=1 Tax=Dermatophagoides pteronyssinus TaxID=6956 RepID=A0A6P6Y3C5_DERPT|nr:store-operated calcium entry-associated regulatory factor-like [Dermatophagoides pteronyssinus]
MVNHHLMLLFIALYCMMMIEVVAGQENDRIKLKDVDSLTFHSGSLTKSRRNEAVAQLTCVGDDYCNQVNVSTVTCYNNRTVNNFILWHCEADLPSNYALVQKNISCEGYDSPEDEYILVGSCSLQYYLEDRGIMFKLKMAIFIIIILLVLSCGCCCCCCCCCCQKKSDPDCEAPTSVSTARPSELTDRSTRG